MHNKYRNALLTTSASSIWHLRAIIDITSIDLDAVPRTTQEKTGKWRICEFGLLLFLMNWLYFVKRHFEPKLMLCRL